MANAIRPLNLTDFRGGLNLRADAFQLADNESPEMLNVDVDPRGGVRSRRGWEKWANTVGGTWAATRLHVFESAASARSTLLVSNGSVLFSTGGAWTTMVDGVGAFTVSATVHGADFADWAGKSYIVCGRGKTSKRWPGAGAATAMTSNGPTWQNTYTAPVGGYMPSADYATTYQGYMVVASTKEDGTDYPNRVRFSHPNSPENWAALDFVDIEGGGPRITGLVAFSDHVVVFKTNSVWAIYGNDIDSFTPVNITMLAGAPHRNAIAVSESGAFFYSHPSGVQFYTPGSGVNAVAEQLQPIIDSGELQAAALSKVFVGFLNRRLWFSAPYEKDNVPTDARATFVYDPSLKSWTLYRDGDGDGLGPFATGASQGDGALPLAAHRIHAVVVKVDANDDALDTIDAGAVGFKTLYATRWLHAGWPALQKSWRRPDYVFTQEASQYLMNIAVHRDYDESVARSRHTALVAASAGTTWGSVNWGSSYWGGLPAGALVVPGGTIGLAKATQLKFEGTVGLPWALNTVVMKFRNRRFR